MTDNSCPPPYDHLASRSGGVQPAATGRPSSQRSTRLSAQLSGPPSAAVPDSPARAAAAARKRGAAAVDARIHDAVVKAVMGQRLPPGTRLGECELCALYDVSRTTVRKALQRLAHDHIVELRPNRGAVVASPLPGEARDVFAARRALEREVLPLVIAHATPAGLKALRAALRAEEAARRDGDRAAWIRLRGEFHLLLADLAGNAVLRHFLGELVSRCSLIVALYDTPGVPRDDRDDDHAALLALIERGDTVRAVALVDRHLRQIEAALRLDAPPRQVDLATALHGGRPDAPLDA